MQDPGGLSKKRSCPGTAGQLFAEARPPGFAPPPGRFRCDLGLELSDGSALRKFYFWKKVLEGFPGSVHIVGGRSV